MRAQKAESAFHKTQRSISGNRYFVVAVYCGRRFEFSDTRQEEKMRQFLRQYRFDLLLIVFPLCMVVLGCGIGEVAEQIL